MEEFPDYKGGLAVMSSLTREPSVGSRIYRMVLWAVFGYFVASLSIAGSAAAEQDSPHVAAWQIKGILAALKDGYQKVRGLALNELDQLLAPDRVWDRDAGDLANVLFNRLLDIHSKDAPPSYVADVEALARLGASDAISELATLSRDKSADVRIIAVQALGRLGARDALSNLAADQGVSSDVRAEAIEALGRLGDTGMVQAFNDLVKNRDLSPAIRAAAAEALGRLGARDATPAISKLAADQGVDSYFRAEAIEALGRLGDTGMVQTFENLVKDRDVSPAIRAAAAEALGRLGVKDSVPALEVFLTDESVDDYVDRNGLFDHDPRAAAVAALTGLGASDTPAFKNVIFDSHMNLFLRLAAMSATGKVNAELVLKNSTDSDPFRVIAELTLGRRKDAVITLKKLIGDETMQPIRFDAAREFVEMDVNDALPWLVNFGSDLGSAVAAALNAMDAKDAVPAIKNILKDETLLSAYGGSLENALDRLGADDNDAVPVLEKLLAHDPRWPPLLRAASARALGRLGARDAVPTLQSLLTNDAEDIQVRAAAIVALGRLRDKSAVPTLLTLIKKTPYSSERAPAAEAVLRLGGEVKTTLFLDLPYENTQETVESRWLAHYTGGGNQKAEYMCDYLGRPFSEPQAPEHTKVSGVLKALKSAWKESDSRWLREDAGGWISIIVSSAKWTKADESNLQELADLLRSNVAATARTRIYATAIVEIIAPFKIWPPPWARSLGVFAGANVMMAVLVMIVRPGRGGLMAWVPFLDYLGIGPVSWSVNTVKQLNLDPWLLGGLLVVELIMLVGAGAVSPPVLRQIAGMEPINHVAIPLALSLPRARWRIFRDHVERLLAQLEHDRRAANDEKYMAAPAVLICRSNTDGKTDPEPVPSILNFLCSVGRQQAHVLVEAPGGRGKSALLREVIRQAVEEFKKSPGSKPVPVFLTESGETIAKMTEKSLGSALVSPDFLALHLEAGDLLLVLDGVSESGLSEKAIDDFVRGPYGAETSLVLGARPVVTKYRDVIERTANWMVVEPQRLNEATLGDFVKHYGGTSLSEPLKAACRGGVDHSYLPILVRMAMTIQTQNHGGASVANVYRGYFLRLFESQYPDEAERLAKLGEAARWCLDTYWKDGIRRRAYEPHPGSNGIERQLYQAGVIISADQWSPGGKQQSLPREVQFFHDSMQSYLTAHGLAAQDRDQYAHLPRPNDADPNKAWDRSRVLLWAAANPKFAGTRSDILQTGGSELFQMCLAEFTSKEDVRNWISKELDSWGKKYHHNLRAWDVQHVLEAIPEKLVSHFQDRSGAEMLELATRAGFEGDQKTDSVNVLGRLYAGIAQLVYQFEENVSGAVL